MSNYPDDVTESMIDEYFASAECRYCKYFDCGYCDLTNCKTDSDDYCDCYQYEKEISETY